MLLDQVQAPVLLDVGVGELTWASSSLRKAGSPDRGS